MKRKHIKRILNRRASTKCALEPIRHETMIRMREE
jgi:hypothetical protein